MKKQAFLYLGIWLSLFNTLCFSMQSEDEILIKKHEAIKRQLDRMEEEEKERDKPITPEQYESLFPCDTFNTDRFLHSSCGKLAPIIEKEKKKTMNDYIHSMLIGSAKKTEKDIVLKNATFLESIQEHSLEGQYEEKPFILFHGPFGTGKTDLALKFARLLNKKTQNILLEDLTEKNSNVLQHVIKEHVKTIIAEDGEPCVLFLDEIDRLLCPSDPNDENKKILAQSLVHCLSEAQRINRDKNQQKYFIVAATNYPGSIKEILPYFKSIEIGNPNFDKLVEILSNLISKESYSFDTSTLDQNTIENIAKRFEGISIRDLRRLIEHSTLNAGREYHENTGQNSHLTKPPLCERHFIADEKVFKSRSEGFARHFAQCQEMGLKYLEPPKEKNEPEAPCPESSDHLSVYDEELAPIVDKEEKERENSFIRSYFLANNPKIQNYLAWHNMEFLESIQEYSLEGQYKKTPFILFHGPNETDKVVIARNLAQLLNKKVKNINLDALGRTNPEYIQRFIEEQIDEDGEPCVILLNNIEKLLCPDDSNDDNRMIVDQHLVRCLEKAQRINQEKNQQKYFIVATTNCPKITIPKEASDFFTLIEISYLNFDQRVEILNDFIHKMDDTVDSSAWDQNLIEDVAKAFEGYSISKLNHTFEQAVMMAQEEHAKEFGPKNNKASLQKRHVTQAKKLLDKQDTSAQQTEEPSAQQDSIFKKISNLFSKYISVPLLNSGKANFIKDNFGCALSRFNSIIIIAFSFLLRKPF